MTEGEPPFLHGSELSRNIHEKIQILGIFYSLGELYVRR